MSGIWLDEEGRPYRRNGHGEVVYLDDPAAGEVNAGGDEADGLFVLADPKAPVAVARAVIDRRWRSAGLLTLRYWRGCFQLWEGTHWGELEKAAVRAELYRTLETAFFEARGRLRPWEPTRLKISDVVDALAGLTHLPETVEPPAWLEGAAGPPPGELVAVRNGLLHVPTRELLAHDPRLFNLAAVPFEHDPKAPEPRQWLAFLDQLWPGDDEGDQVAALGEFFGYSISGDTSLHKILLAVGPTRAGKGVIARILTDLVGRKNVAAPTLASLGENFGLSPLLGKRLAVVSDARLGGAGTHTVVERLLSISGEDSITVDRKYREPWTGKLGTRFFIISNELPRLGDSSAAIAKRFVVLTLRNSWLGREDPRLTDTLRTELPGILNWALDGLERLRRQGYFTRPAGSEEAVLALEDLASPAAAFVRECCQVAPLLEVPVDDLNHAWRRWCEEQGRNATNAQHFGRDLRAVVPGLHTKRGSREGDTRHRVYLGLTLREAP